jgi:hypothetical protein
MRRIIHPALDDNTILKTTGIRSAPHMDKSAVSPALPPSRSRMVEPLSTPAGIFNVTSLVSATCPCPLQAPQCSSTSSPLPPHFGHGCTLLNTPKGVRWTLLTAPWPPQVPQDFTFAPGLTPVPKNNSVTVTNQRTLLKRGGTAFKGTLCPVPRTLCVTHFCTQRTKLT